MDKMIPKDREPVREEERTSTECLCNCPRVQKEESCLYHLLIGHPCRKCVPSHARLVQHPILTNGGQPVYITLLQNPENHPCTRNHEFGEEAPSAAPSSPSRSTSPPIDK